MLLAILRRYLFPIFNLQYIHYIFVNWSVLYMNGKGCLWRYVTLTINSKLYQILIPIYLWKAKIKTKFRPYSITNLLKNCCTLHIYCKTDWCYKIYCTKVSEIQRFLSSPTPQKNQIIISWVQAWDFWFSNEKKSLNLIFS